MHPFYQNVKIFKYQLVTIILRNDVHVAREEKDFENNQYFHIYIFEFKVIEKLFFLNDKPTNWNYSFETFTTFTLM